MSPSPRILIVDDDEMVLNVLARTLSREGFDVRTAVTPLEGLDEAEQTRPDAILLDLRMPFVNGIGFLYRLRGHSALQHTPVAIMTGDSNIDDSAKAELLALRAELLFKPLMPDDVVRATRRLVEQGSAARAAHR
jgi:DNA-binding response OmpR family regulator